ncbi:MAG: McrC family protein [Lachnospiraceae bacterium]
MRSFRKTYIVTEFGGFTRDKPICGYCCLPEGTFDALEKFILANTSGTDTEATELLSLSYRRGIGKIITARNYVGLITMTDGTVIEILPKIADDNITDEEAKRIFLEMLKTLKDLNFKDFNVSNLHIERLSILEIFIKMFLNEVTILTKQGLKSAYASVENNERFCKGKLLASQNIKYNIVSRERFFVQYDEFSINRSENRLIKSTLRYLLRLTADSHNRKSAARLLTFFEGADYSTSYDTDISKCISDRSMSHYDKALSWCRVFLRGNSFTSFAGSEVALALLFPMEKVFENFIASKFRKYIWANANLWIQDTRYNLFDIPSRAFALRPDLVLETGGKTVVLDTKWKLLSDKVKNNGIAQSDMYQMYAYSKKYKANRVVLLYPKSNTMSTTNIKYYSDDNVKAQVSFIDLRNADDSIAKLIAELC